MFFTKTDDYQEMCDTNKNVTKMDVIIRKVYCNWAFKIEDLTHFGGA